MRNKLPSRSLVACFLFLNLPAGLSAQSAFNFVVQNHSTADGHVLTLKSYMTHHYENRTWGTFGYFLFQETWAEAYGGLLISPRPWVELGAGAGLEQADDPWRVLLSIWLGHSKLSWLNLFEEGGSGYWFESLLVYRSGERVGVGLLAQRYVGLGPYFEINLPQSPIQLWVSPAYDWEREGMGILANLQLNY